MDKENNNLFIRAILFILHIVSVIIRGTLFILVKLIYRLFKLWEFEQIRDDVFLTKSDGLSHTFNFKRSMCFKKKYNDLLSNLKWMKSSIQIDLHNNTNYSDEILDEIIEEIDELIILAESESLSKGFNFRARRNKGMSYTDKNDYILDFFLENEMNRYNNMENDLDNLK